MVVANHEILEVAEVSQDYISDLILLDDRMQLAVTSWDGTLSIYDYNDAKTVSLKSSLQHTFPLLSCCYLMAKNRARYLYVSSVQSEILQVDLEAGRFVPVRNNKADLGISSMCRYREYIICGSWDGLLQVVNCETNSVIFHQRLHDDAKVLSMDINEDKLIVASTKNKIRWFNLPLDENPGFEVESGLKYQSRNIKLTPQGDGYVSGSLDGRVAVEFFNDEHSKFAFRCHRMNLVDKNFVFPVNALSFVPKSYILYTGGSDGCVSCWNLSTRKKMEQLPKFNENSVVQLACNGKVLCVATSDDSFKNSAVANEDFKLQPSRLYMVFL